MMDFRDMPEAMRVQAAEGKKDRYIEIATCFIEKAKAGICPAEQAEYIRALKEVLDSMDFQIYEYYRALQDLFVDAMKLSGAECLEEEEYRNLLAWGEAKHFLLPEWFLPDTYDGFSSMDISGMETIVLKNLCTTPRSVTIELSGKGKYEADDVYLVYVNGEERSTPNTVVRSIFGLLPGRTYEITVVRQDRKAAGRMIVETSEESVTLNVKDFGALGDGESDDTACIQAAVMNCPKQGRVLIPEGTFCISSLFLKSHMQLELAKGAVLKGIPTRKGHGIQPGFLPSTNGSHQYNFGSWEGNPLPMFSGILTAVDAEDIYIYGEGVLDGNASKETWWLNPKQMNMAYRPRLFFVRDCSRVYMQGITLMNSPSWTIHPYFSSDLGFYNITVRNPFDSPNTDGLDPESCKGVEIAGVSFSLGDDCIAVKAGKIYMGKGGKHPSESIRIHNCKMENGHGAVTIGSEMAGGVKNLTVEDCVFSHTDRGLRIKTRRGRGRDAILDRIIFRNITMDHVMTPFVVNSFYFCDPDGKTPYVQSRECMPVDERTPFIKRLEFEDIEAGNCHVAAAYIEGLPEQKIEELIMRHVSISFTDQPKKDVPAMSEGVEACTKKGIFVRNVKRVTLDHVSVSGNEGETVETIDVDELVH